MITALQVHDVKDGRKLIGKEVSVFVQPPLTTKDEAMAAAFLELATELGYATAQKLLDRKETIVVKGPHDEPT